MSLKIHDFMKLHGRVMHRIMENIHKQAGMPHENGMFKGLTPRQVGALFEITSQSPCSLSDIADALKITLPSASVLVNTLVEKGVVIRKPDPEDRRRVVLEVEPEAEKLVKELKSKAAKVFQKIVDGIGEEEFQKWYEILLKVDKIVI